MKCDLIHLQQTSATRYISKLINTKHVLEFCSQNFVWIENYILSVHLICTYYINIYVPKILIKSVFAAWRITTRITRRKATAAQWIGVPLEKRPHAMYQENFCFSCYQEV